MKHFLSAFSDGDATRIVANCKEVLAPGGRILLLQVGSKGLSGGLTMGLELHYAVEGVCSIG
jgi:hypothetical protein